MPLASALLFVLALPAPSMGRLGVAPAPAAKPAGDPEAMRLLERAQRAVLGENASYRLRMTVLRGNRAPRVVEMDGFKLGDDRGLVRYTDPPKERGSAYLRREETTYVYLPNAEKVVRVGPKQTFGGGDFNNGDIFRLSLTADYIASLAGEETIDGVRCRVLELKARDRSVAYDRVRYLVRADPLSFPVLAEYFTISGKKLKTLRTGDVAVLGGRPRPTRLLMENALEPQASTEIRFLEIDDQPRLDERMFTPQSLERR